MMSKSKTAAKSKTQSSLTQAVDTRPHKRINHCNNRSNMKGKRHPTIQQDHRGTTALSKSKDPTPLTPHDSKSLTQPVILHIEEDNQIKGFKYQDHFILFSKLLTIPNLIKKDSTVGIYNHDALSLVSMCCESDEVYELLNRMVFPDCCFKESCRIGSACSCSLREELNDFYDKETRLRIIELGSSVLLSLSSNG
ncbi:hypothetical protein WICPIJ_009998 [Wickerhamomyces pijperi]|uniref:Uncharacterized protein n=1 Tax=Wickerhamomyces pijperi TaxID=599730 RepID=A0A9P8PIU7_WICPI|nr:hypothetical protein WICPIJ_009998 [Wickerhamomyces pijperi]